MIGVAGGDFDLFRKRGYDTAMEIQMNVGVLDYCGVKEPRYEILYGALEGEASVSALISDVQRLASEF